MTPTERYFLPRNRAISSRFGMPQNPRWQALMPNGEWVDFVHIRLKPTVTQANSCNGHAIGHRQVWHRYDWDENMIRSGFRPLLLGEFAEPGDEIYHGRTEDRITEISEFPAGRETPLTITKRPVPKQPE